MPTLVNLRGWPPVLRLARLGFEVVLARRSRRPLPPTVASPASVSRARLGFEKAVLPLLLTSAPPLLTPVPEIVTASWPMLIVFAPISSVAPAATLVPELVAPRAPLLPILRVPCETVVGPVYVLATPRVSAPVPFWPTLPKP